MLKTNNLQISNESSIRVLGLEKIDPLFNKIHSKLEDLREKSPANCILELTIKQRKSSYFLELTVKSYINIFKSKKVSQDIMQAFLSAHEDIEIQLFEWKKKRFTNKLEISITTASSA